MQQSTQPMQVQFEQLHLDGDKYKNILKELNNRSNDIDVDDYGICEDVNYITPQDPTVDKVDMLELKVKSETDKIKKNVRKLRKILLKLNRDINEVQKSSYRYLITKRRHREVSITKREIKKDRKRTIEESRTKRQNLQTISRMTVNDLKEEKERDEYDDFDLDDLM